MEKSVFKTDYFDEISRYASSKFDDIETLQLAHTICMNTSNFHLLHAL